MNFYLAYIYLLLILNFSNNSFAQVPVKPVTPLPPYIVTVPIKPVIPLPPYTVTVPVVPPVPAATVVPAVTANNVCTTNPFEEEECFIFIKELGQKDQCLSSRLERKKAAAQTNSNPFIFKSLTLQR